MATDGNPNSLLSDNLNELKCLVEAGNSVNAYFNGVLFLNYVMKQKQVDIFDYLLSLDEIDVNFLDKCEQTPLIYLVKNCFDGYFARRLIDRGADINFVDVWGSTFLSYMARKRESDDYLSIGELVVEKGADINWPNYSGKTALCYACMAGNFAWVCMLLYHGADATIATNQGILPLLCISRNMPENQRSLLEEIVYNYTFDNDKIRVKLPTLVEAMTNDSELFLKILEKVSDIDYDVSDLQYMAFKLRYIKIEHLEIFMTKFSHVIQELIHNFPPLNIPAGATLQELLGIIDFFLKSDYAADFVQSSLRGRSVIAGLLKIYDEEYQNPSIYKEDFTKMICLLLTYGLRTVTSRDLDAVHSYLGYCELFQILLHMDIVMIEPHYPDYQIRSTAFYYNPCLRIDDLLNNIFVSPVLLDYFNDYKLKKMYEDNVHDIFNVYDDKTLERVKNLPQVPLLVELSRNAARKYIVDRFNAKKSVHFYTVLKWLPIGDVHRSIIALEKKLY